MFYCIRMCSEMSEQRNIYYKNDVFIQSHVFSRVIWDAILHSFISYFARSNCLIILLIPMDKNDCYYSYNFASRHFIAICRSLFLWTHCSIANYMRRHMLGCVYHRLLWGRLNNMIMLIHPACCSTVVQYCNDHF